MSEVLIVTGGGRGIGAATVRLAAERGWKVVFSYLSNAGSADALVREVEAAGGEAFAVRGDTSVEVDVKAMFDAAEKRFGPVHGLVNNAGMGGGPTTVENMDTAELRRLMDVNVIGYFLCAQEAVRRMSTANGGRGGVIVNIASVAAANGGVGERVHYAASKGAVVAMTNGLAREVISKGIRVNCISPGLTVTDANPPERLKKHVPNIPIGRAADAREIAKAILFMLSEESSYVLGINMTVSGGR